MRAPCACWTAFASTATTTSHECARRARDTWQLVINTATTVLTFLAVFLIQNTQNRDARAIPAGAIYDSGDIFGDPHLREREMVQLAPLPDARPGGDSGEPDSHRPSAEQIGAGAAPGGGHRGHTSVRTGNG